MLDARERRPKGNSLTDAGSRGEPVAERTTLNESAARNLEEDLKETLTLHRLDLHDDLRRNLCTSNLIESAMAQRCNRGYRCTETCALRPNGSLTDNPEAALAFSLPARRHTQAQ